MTARADGRVARLHTIHTLVSIGLADRERRRGAGGLGSGNFCVGEDWVVRAEVMLNRQGTKSVGQRLRVSPLSSSDGAATIVVAGTGVADDKLIGFRHRRVVAVMRGFSDAAGMRRRRGSCHGERREVTRKCDEQQESGDQSVHASWENHCSGVRPDQHRAEREKGASERRAGAPAPHCRPIASARRLRRR